MMSSLVTLLNEIRQGKLLPKELFVRDDLDEILDERDKAEFEKPWLECSERIESAWSDAEIDESTKNTMDEIRKESFLAVSRATEQHEIASYVSDDFELIGKSIAVNLGDPYAAGLLESYRQGNIPR